MKEVLGASGAVYETIVVFDENLGTTDRVGDRVRASTKPEPEGSDERRDYDNNREATTTRSNAQAIK